MPRAVTLSPVKPTDGSLSAWNWGLDPACATYHALFPRAWTVYEEPLPGIRMTCRQVSPFIPGDYRESSYPVGVFSWQVENTGQQPVEVSLMFTFQNGTGSTNDSAGGHTNSPFTLPMAEGVNLRHVHRQPKTDLSEREKSSGDHRRPLNLCNCSQKNPGS